MQLHNQPKQPNQSMLRKSNRSKTLLSHSQPRIPNFAKTVLAGLMAFAFTPLQFVYAQGQPMASEVNTKNTQESLAQNSADSGVAKQAGDRKAKKTASKKDSKPVPRQDPATLSTVMQAESVTGQPDLISHLENNVEVTRGDMVFTADKATYQHVEDQLDASGNVTLTRNGDCYRGDVLQFILDTSIGFVTNPSYFFGKTNGQGKAEKIEFASDERSTITNGTYSTCPGLSPDWYLKTDTLSLDTGLDLGAAGKSVLYFKDVPILPVPAWMGFSFPLSGARHSGLLPPVVGHSNKGGIEFGLPYYFNIAPNRDFTIAPKMITKRGIQLGLEGRYLGETYAGETAVEAINDKLTDTTRYAITSVHKQALLPQLQFSWNMNKASDNDYPSDFSSSTTKTAQRLLLRDIGLDYYGSFWNASLRSTSYQVLQDLNAPITLPYERLPQLTFHAGQNDVFGMDWSVDAIVTRFWHPTLVHGQRAVLNPQLSIPFVQPAFFITPKISLHAVNYQLDNPEPGKPSSLQTVVPSISLDAGLIFERQMKLFEKNLTQTLEPRLFYVNTPYRDQKNNPRFDTGNADFNFAQIFSENRFTGNDLVGDSNQITAALISKFIEEDGVERVKLALGQRFYFNQERVTLDNSVNPSRSDLLLAGSGQISDQLRVDAALQYSQSDGAAVRSNYGFHWQPAPKKIVNLQYQFQRGELKQLDFSGEWPIANRWYAVGKVNYSLLNRKLVEGLSGFEYRADCWAVRFVGHRFATTTLSNNSGFSIQLELTGLARLGFGTNPIETLKKNISGYQSPN